MSLTRLFCKHSILIGSFRGVARQAVTEKLNIGQRYFCLTPISQLKRIEFHSEGDVTTVEGFIIDSDKKGKVLEIEDERKRCALCPYKLNMEVKYTDVLIISQFLRSDGCVLPRRLTRLCPKAQNRLKVLAHKAQRAGLMPQLRPQFPNGRERTSLKSQYKWKKYNAYYENDTGGPDV